MAEIGLRQRTIRLNVGDAVVDCVGTDGAALNLWDIPLTRQLEMAVCEQNFPDIHVGASTTEQGAWMAFLWDRRGSSLKVHVVSEDCTAREYNP